MDYLAKVGLLNANGEPFSSHIERVLRELAPRLVRQFPALRDEAVVAELLEEAGRKIAEHERRAGPIEKLHGYAWVVIRSVATSRMRRGSMRMERAMLRSEDSQAALSEMPSGTGTADDIERAILLDEILSQLSEQERILFMWKKAGFSSKEIATGLDMSSAAVDQLFHRLKEKLQAAFGHGHRPATLRSLDLGQRKPMAKLAINSRDKAADKANG